MDALTDTITGAKRHRPDISHGGKMLTLREQAVAQEWFDEGISRNTSITLASVTHRDEHINETGVVRESNSTRQKILFADGRGPAALT